MKRLLVAIVALVVVGTAGGAGAMLYRPTPQEPVELEIPSGASTTRIATLLASEGVISSETGFRVMSRLRGLDGRIQAGQYELHRGMGVHAALDALEAGATVNLVSVPIPEGFTVDQIAERVGDRTHITETEFREAVESGEVRASIQPDDVDSLEGFLFPDTYMVDPNETAEGLLRRMVGAFDDRTADLDWTPAEERGLTPYEAIVAASLIEREARVAEDRAKISAVIYNRLEIGMRLQIDATALYDLDEHKVPTRADLRRESPWNTYLIDGLPPTPIANPGIEAIRATLAPDDIDAIFYVVIDPSGKHGFTASYDEFLRMRDLRPEETRGGS